MKLPIKTFLFGFFLVMFAFASCASENDNGAAQSDKLLTITFKKDHWTYVSIREGRVLGQASISDSTAEKSWKARTDWDIAICNGYIRTNSGASGSGLGGITVSSLPYDETDASSASGFVVDADTVCFEKDTF